MRRVGGGIARHLTFGHLRSLRLNRGPGRLTERGGGDVSSSFIGQFDRFRGRCRLDKVLCHLINKAGSGRPFRSVRGYDIFSESLCLDSVYARHLDPVPIAILDYGVLWSTSNIDWMYSGRTATYTRAEEIASPPQ
jgi:hypothetical protein